MRYDILTQNQLPWQTDEWQKKLSASNLSVNKIYDRFSPPESDKKVSEKADEIFRTKAPEGFLQKIGSNLTNDPLFLQIFPDKRELESEPGYVQDPLGESECSPVPGLLHKYKSRVLLVMTNACAIHCRYCFRRHFPYEENRLTKEQWKDLVDYIARDDSINEIILSGGDPLTLKTELLQKRLQPILSLPHVRRIRFHTRLPSVLPERIDAKLLNWLDELNQQKVMVLHVNHSDELDASFDIAMDQLRSRGVMLLNQAVLLRGVNDNVQALVRLSERLMESSVLPYYLHLLDRVSGAAHFEVPEKEAEEIYEGLLSSLPGFMVPKLVREISGRSYKVPLSGCR